MGPRGEFIPDCAIPLYCSVLFKKYHEGLDTKGRVYLPYPATQVFLENDLIDTTHPGLVIAAESFQTEYSEGLTTMKPVVHEASSGDWVLVDQVRIANYATHRKWRGVNHFQSSH